MIQRDAVTTVRIGPESVNPEVVRESPGLVYVSPQSVHVSIVLHLKHSLTSGKKISENISLKSLKSFIRRSCAIFSLASLHMHKCKHLSNSCMPSSVGSNHPGGSITVVVSDKVRGTRAWLTTKTDLLGDCSYSNM